MSVTPGFQYVIVWEFRVKAGREAEFVEKYGPEGVWARFFRRSEGYIRTELVNDVTDRLRFLTLDYWRSHEDFNWFREMFQREYERFTQLVTDEGIIERQRVVGSFYIDDSDLGLVST